MICCTAIAGKDRAAWVQNVYAFYKRNTDHFEADFAWWQLGDFASSAIDVANTETLQQLCLRLFALEKARQVMNILFV